MSGSSLDGLDMALIRFDQGDDVHSPHWTILQSSTVPYDAALVKQLRAAPNSSAHALYLLEAAYSRWVANAINRFLASSDDGPSWIGWHGHTIFHNPEEGTTLQIGHGATIAALTGIATICDFRMQDVALNGQGAPMAPIVDYRLLRNTQYFLNLGGICNGSVLRGDKILSGDLSVCNQALNHLSAKVGQPFDQGGALARQGQSVPQVLTALNDLPFHSQALPKSLDNNWVTKHVLPILDQSSAPVVDLLHTCVEHIVMQIVAFIEEYPQSERAHVQCAGGGAHNRFLMEVLQQYLQPLQVHVVQQDATLIDFKECLLMAYMAYCYLLGIPNVLSSVTGAKHDSIGGCLHRGAANIQIHA
ncbi:MAG: anhydro-N-acetylmuramic acid kinase [Saprospiraceae bacterium]|nr:anhydro-N-acetylmuramic acid kinase [Saprospiraceae bacterium]